MARLILVILLLLVCAVFYLRFRLHRLPDRQHLESEVDAEIGKMMKRGLAVGLVIGIVKEGRTVIKGYGSVSKETTLAPTASTLFEIASITKVFTATTLQALADAGVQRLDATLGELLPAEFLAASVRNVTLRQLATHRSGFPPVPKTYLEKIPDTANISRDVTAADLLAYLADPKGKRPAGKFTYSNFGAGLLGYLLARCAGKSYEALVAESVLAPLGMTNTAVTLTTEQRENLAQGHSMKGDSAKPLDWAGGTLDGAGALKSTAHDMTLFIKANLADDDSALSRSLRETHRANPGGQTALGWMLPGFIERFVGNSSILWHNGLTPGYAAYIAIDPRNKTGLVILVNRAVDITLPGIMLMRLVRTQSWAS